MRSSRLVEVLGLVVAAVAAASMSGCLARERADAIAAFGPLRAESLKPWTNTTIAGEPAIEYAIANSAFVLEDADAALAQLIIKPDGNTKAKLVIERRGRQSMDITGGSAVPIAPDGYFLTAAHVVELDNALLLARTAVGPYLETTIRRVWSGASLSPEFDVAIVHAPGISLPAVAWAPIDRLTPGAETIAAGLGGRWPRSVGGTISSVHAFEPIPGVRPATWAIHVCGPYIPGDSGGPTFLSDGRLVGIAAAISFEGRADRNDRVTCELLRVDPAWLDLIIARDRASRNATSPAPRAQPTDAHTLLETLDARTLDVDGWHTPERDPTTLQPTDTPRPSS